MSLAILSLAAQNVSMYPLVPGGIKCFIVPFGPWRDNPINMRLLRGRFLQLCPLRQKFLNNKCVNGLCRELGNLSVL